MSDTRCCHCLGSGRAVYTRNTYYDYEETCHRCHGTGREDVVVISKQRYKELTESKNAKTSDAQ